MKKKCYIYTRVSTAAQTEGHSLEAQQERLRQYAEYKNLEIAGEYCDAGKSGKSILGRPAFMEMMDDIRAHVSDVTDEDEMRAYIGKIVDKEAFDHKGLVYGMGHAVYSLSDPRAVVFKSFVQQLAMAKGRKTDFDFYNTVERLAPQVIAEKRHIYKGVSTNVDFYSGFVYNMLGIPVELYTPMFAVARVVGWSAHRMEELVNVDKIIRPAYKSVMATRDYLPMENRG